MVAHEIHTQRTVSLRRKWAEHKWKGSESDGVKLILSLLEYLANIQLISAEFCSVSVPIFSHQLEIYLQNGNSIQNDNVWNLYK